MMGFIERHGEIFRAAHRPVGDGLPGGKVGHLNFLLVRDIDEDAAPHLLELEGLGVRIRGDLAHLLAREIHDPHRAVALLARGRAIEELFPAIADDDVLVLGVVAEVVGVGRVLDRLQQLESLAIEHLH